MSRYYINESFTVLPLFVVTYPYADKLCNTSDTEAELFGRAEGTSNLQPTLFTVTYVLLDIHCYSKMNLFYKHISAHWV
jgi:hypothetical protein